MGLRRGVIRAVRRRPRALPFEAGECPPESFLARYWAKVDGSGGPTACWLWTGARSRKSHGDYGILQFGGRGSPKLIASRVALFLATGDPGEDRDACHTDNCTTTLCVNPAHLYWGEHRDNYADNERKYGRAGNGRFQGRAATETKGDPDGELFRDQ